MTWVISQPSSAVNSDAGQQPGATASYHELVITNADATDPLGNGPTAALDITRVGAALDASGPPVVEPARPYCSPAFWARASSWRCSCRDASTGNMRS